MPTQLFNFIRVSFARFGKWLNGETIFAKIALSIIANIITTPPVVILTLALLFGLGVVPFNIGIAPGLSSNTISCDHGTTEIYVWSKQIPKRLWIKWSDKLPEEEAPMLLDNSFYGVYLKHDYGAINNNIKQVVNIRYIDQMDYEHEAELAIFLLRCERK